MSYDISDFVTQQGPSGFVRLKEPGDYVVGKVLSWDMDTGGKDYNDDECGHMDFEDATIVSQGQRFVSEAGETKQLTIDAKRSLRTAVSQLNPKIGQICGIKVEAKRKSNRSPHSWLEFVPVVPKKDQNTDTSLPEGLVELTEPSEAGGSDLVGEAF